MNKKLHILFLADGIHPFTIGGMQKYSSELVKGFLRNGNKVTLVYSVSHDREIPAKESVREKLEIDLEFFSEFSPIGIKFPSPGKWPGHYIKESHLFSKLVYEKVESDLSNFDFIYAQGFTAWYLLEKKMEGVRMPEVGVNFHGLNMFQKTYGWKAWIIANMFKKAVKKNLIMADIVFSYGGVFNSIYTKLGVGNKIFFQPIGIDESTICQSDSDAQQPLKLVFIGRNDKVKGLNFYQRVIKQQPENKFQFYFIGDIPKEIQLKRNDCTYLGIITDRERNDILLNSDVLVCPSFSEGMPYVILEAMSKGMMIIASKVGAISEMVSASNSILFDPGDRKQLNDCLQKLSEFDSNEIKKFKIQSSIEARKFSWELIIGSTMEELEKRLKILNK